MREIPVSSLGSDKVRVVCDDEHGDYVVTVGGSSWGNDIRSVIPTAALLAIVADRLEQGGRSDRDADGRLGVVARASLNSLNWARGVFEEYRELTNPDHVGEEGR